MVGAFSISNNFGFSFVALLFAGLGTAGFSAMQSAILLLAAPPQARSRVMGALVLCIGSQPFGVLHLGLLADWFGAPTAITIVSIEGLLLFICCLYRWPQLLLR